MPNPFPAKDHRISLQHAIDMTKRYRENKATVLAAGTAPDTLAICETFSKESVMQLLSEARVVSFRIYYGMDESKKIHAILVGADEAGKDILPLVSTEVSEGEEEMILEEAHRCPPECPPPSPLNES